MNIADANSLMPLTDYNNLVKHLDEISNILNKYDLLSERCISDMHVLKCKVADVRSQLDCIRHGE